MNNTSTVVVVVVVSVVIVSVVVSVVLLLLGIRISGSDGSVDLVANTSLLATMMDYLIIFFFIRIRFIRLSDFSLVAYKNSLWPVITVILIHTLPLPSRARLARDGFYSFHTTQHSQIILTLTGYMF